MIHPGLCDSIGTNIKGPSAIHSGRTCGTIPVTAPSATGFSKRSGRGSQSHVTYLCNATREPEVGVSL